MFMLVMFIHIFVQNYPMALLVRAIGGFVAAPLSSLGLYYVMQAFSSQYRLQGLYIGFGVSALAIPLAWIMSYLVNVNERWTRLYTFLSLVWRCVVLRWWSPSSCHEVYVLKCMKRKTFSPFVIGTRFWVAVWGVGTRAYFMVGKLTVIGLYAYWRVGAVDVRVFL